MSNVGAESSAGLGIDLLQLPPQPGNIRRTTIDSPFHDDTAYESYGSLGSIAAMESLLQTETGEYMVDLKHFQGVSSSRDGRRTALETVTQGDSPQHERQVPLAISEQAALSRHGTLLSLGGTPGRNAAELKYILGGSKSRLKPGAALLPTPGQILQDEQRTAFEQAKSRVRVEVDIILNSNTYVQGGYIQGHVKIRIHKSMKEESHTLISGGKVRVIGFECISNEHDRYPFYQCSSPLSNVTTASKSLYGSPADEEGFARAVEGEHMLPFSMYLPLSADYGVPKGAIPTQSGLAVRYIAMASIKVKVSNSDRRSIAHFYRNCEIWPRLNPSVVLAPADKPLQKSTSKGLFMGGGGKVDLTASLHRLHWIAGQQCYVKVAVINNTKKVIKSVTLSLIRTTVIFKPDHQLDDLIGDHNVDFDACQTSTTQKQVAESILELGKSGLGVRYHASAKGWWTGVSPGEHLEFFHFILLPPDALSVTRSRLLEVDYFVRVTLSAGTLPTADVQVVIPIRIVNFLSIDPPPSFPSMLHDEPMQRSDTDFHSSGSTKFCDAMRSQGKPPSRPGVATLFDFCGSNSRAIETLTEMDDKRLPSPDQHIQMDPSENDVFALDDAYGGIDYEIDDSEESHCSRHIHHTYANPDEDLGNITVYEDDPDEIIQCALDPEYENAPRFADLYNASVRDGRLPAPPRSGGNHGPNLCPNSRLPTNLTRPNRPRGPSSFAQRVQEKLEAATHKSQHDLVGGYSILIPEAAIGELAVSSTEQYATSNPSEYLHYVTHDAADVTLHHDHRGLEQNSGGLCVPSLATSLLTPIQEVYEQSPQPQIPTSESLSSLAYRKATSSGFTSISGGSRSLPRPPSMTDIPPPTSLDLDVTTGETRSTSLPSSSPGIFLHNYTSAPRSGLPLSEDLCDTGRFHLRADSYFDPSNLATRPSLFALNALGSNVGGSSSSVKERIRELEERQRSLLVEERAVG